MNKLEIKKATYNYEGYEIKVKKPNEMIRKFGGINIRLSINKNNKNIYYSVLDSWHEAIDKAKEVIDEELTD